jgi:hypothetical protein
MMVILIYNQIGFGQNLEQMLIIMISETHLEV